MKSKLLLLYMLLAPALLPAQEKIIVINEGNWNQNNARLSYFENDRVVSNKWYRDANQSELGDTPVDIIQISDHLLAVSLNTSNFIQFITDEGKAAGTSEEVANVRYMCTDGTDLYVTSYAHECGVNGSTLHFTRGFVAKINIASRKVTAAAEVGYEPEGIALYKGKLYVANSGGYSFSEGHDYEQTVSVLDAATMKAVRTIDTGAINLYSKVSQAGRYLCISSCGNYSDVPGACVIFDCEAVEDGKTDTECFVKLGFPTSYNAADKEGRFYAVGSVYSYETYTSTYYYNRVNPSEVFESAGADGIDKQWPGTMLSDMKGLAAPNGFYINPYTGYFYAADAGDYASAGTLWQWDADGNKKGSYGVYISPKNMVALPPDGHFSGIDNVVVRPEEGDGKIYNLRGIEVREPQPGGLYIRNGKKYIFR